MLKVSDFDYHLPEELIAQFPLKNRTESKMMVINRATGEITSTYFHQLPNYLNPEDCLVFNDTKVIPARIFGKKVREDGSLGANIEILLIDEQDKNIWKCMIKPAKRLKVGGKVQLTDNPAETFTLLEKFPDASCLIEFQFDNVLELLEEIGHMPLPPYISRDDNKDDRETYQTVFAKEPGAVAAPTAGLHFTDEILEQLHEKGCKTLNVTLHVGAGTFKPVQVDNVDDHKMHSERYILPEETASAINDIHSKGGRVFSVGTTSVRVLESNASDDGILTPGRGETDIFIYPPYKAKAVDCLLTNFHLPKSTLLMLVSSLATKDLIMKAYEKAVQEKFRFFSYGDCMLII